jgi:hypothetical protein
MQCVEFAAPLGVRFPLPSRARPRRRVMLPQAIAPVGYAKCRVAYSSGSETFLEVLREGMEATAPRNSKWRVTTVES